MDAARYLARRQDNHEMVLPRPEAETPFGVHVDRPLPPILGRSTQVESRACLAAGTGGTLHSLRSVRTLRPLRSLGASRSRGTGLTPGPGPPRGPRSAGAVGEGQSERPVHW